MACDAMKMPETVRFTVFLLHAVSCDQLVMYDNSSLPGALAQSPHLSVSSKLSSNDILPTIPQQNDNVLVVRSRYKSNTEREGSYASSIESSNSTLVFVIM